MGFLGKLAAILLISLFPSVINAASYYMRADGTAESKAAATSCDAASSAMSTATHNSQTFEPGDTIYLCSNGGTYTLVSAAWNAVGIVAPSSGTAGNVITYSNAPGHTPIISYLRSNANTGWTDLGGGIYSYSTFAKIWFEDGVGLLAATSEALTDGNWYYSSGAGKLYYKPTSGTPADHTLTSIWWDTNVWTPYGIDLRNKNYIKVTGLTFRWMGGGVGHGVNITSPADTITGIEVSSNNFDHLYWAIWSQVVGTSIESNAYIHDNTIDYCNSGISAWTKDGQPTTDTAHHTGYLITRNTISHLFQLSDTKNWNEAVAAHSYQSDHEGISFQEIQNSTISHNTISSNNQTAFSSSEYWTRGIYFFCHAYNAATSGNLVTGNRIFGRYAPALYVSGTTGAVYQNNIWSGNIVHSNDTTTDHNGFSVTFYTNGTNAGRGTNYFVNNVLWSSVDGSGSIAIGSASGGVGTEYTSGVWKFQNNIIKWKKNTYMLANGTIADMTFSHNIYANSADWNFQLGNNAMRYAGWVGASQDTTGSSNADPAFINAGGSYALATDFLLGDESPAKAAGTYISNIHDFNGILLNPASVNIGAFQDVWYSEGKGVSYGR